MTAARYLTAATPLRLAVGGLTVALPILAIEEHGDIALGGALAAAFAYRGRPSCSTAERGAPVAASSPATG
ncbi:hypothetical protein [Agromyces bauzanensis]